MARLAVQASDELERTFQRAATSIDIATNVFLRYNDRSLLRLLLGGHSRAPFDWRLDTSCAV